MPGGYLDYDGLGLVVGKINENVSGKQSKFFGKPGQVVGFDSSENSKVVDGWSNQNLLNNWYFADPINLQWKTEYTGSVSAIDKWNAWGSLKLTLNDGFTELSNTGTGLLGFEQKRTDLLNKLDGQSITISALLTGNILLSASGVIPYEVASDQHLVASDYISGNTGIRLYKRTKYSDIVFQIVVNAGETLPLIAVKLELGSQQTIARQDLNGNWVLNDPSPNKNIEMVRCGLPSWSNKNLLNNWCFFDPINSQNKSQYSVVGVSEYTIDSWLFKNGIFTLMDGFINITSRPSDHGGFCTFRQNIEKMKGMLDGKALSFSMLYRTSSPYFYFTFDTISSSAHYIIPPRVIPVSESWQIFTVTVNSEWPNTVEDTLAQCRIYLNTNNAPVDAAQSIDIKAMKLEFSPCQTLANQDENGNWALNDPFPNKNVESLKCQPVNSADLSGLAFQCSYPTNKLIFDDMGRPGAYVYIPKFRLCDVIATDNTSVHPAFIINGTEIPGFYFGKFQSHISDGRAYSLAAEDPSTSINLNQAVNHNRAKGGKFHEVTAAEWSAIALWCHRNGTEPRGNNDHGKDVSEIMRKAIPMTYESEGAVKRVATGTGPVTWSHDGTLEGIWDMNGNAREWCVGLRLVYGELQVIPYNDAAGIACDLSSTSSAWKAIKAEAVSLDDLFVTPDGNGTTEGTVKLDFINSAWMYCTVISNAVANNGCAFSNVTADITIGDQAKLFLMALAMLPDAALIGDGIAADYNGDYFYARNDSAELCALRSGNWSDKENSGIFCLHLDYARSDANEGTSGRSVYIE